MKNEILELEKNLFKQEYMTNKEWLEKIIHDDFMECGKTGRLYYKEDTIASLLEWKEDRKITIYNYSYNKIDEKTFLIHYITKSNEKLYYRTSIWVKEENVKLFYHQATEFCEKITLSETDNKESI